MNFLGVLLDSGIMMIELPEEKIIELKRISSNLITKDKITKRQLQSLVRKIELVIYVHMGGGTYVYSQIAGSHS